MSDVDRELCKLKDSIDDLWDSHEHHKKGAKDTAKLAVFTAREAERLGGRHDLAIFANGPLKEALKRKWSEYRAAKKGGGTAKQEETGQGGGSASAQVGGVDQMAEVGDALPAAKAKTWKTIYTETLLVYLQSQVTENSSARLKKAHEDCASLLVDEATVAQRFHKPEAPEGTAPWVCDLHLDGGVQGSKLYSLLVHDFKALYVRDGPVSVKPRGTNKDRPLAGPPLGRGHRGVRRDPGANREAYLLPGGKTW